MMKRGDIALVVIDLQDKLLAKVPGAEQVVEQTIKLIRVFGELALPILLTEQYPKGLGPTNDRVREALGDTTAIEKTAFGCFGDEGFVTALEGLGSDQILLAGVETHVCVCQTACQAIERGYEVYVARDAVASRAAPEAEAGLQRMADEAALIVTTEMAIFELLEEAGTDEFKRVLPLMK